MAIYKSGWWYTYQPLWKMMEWKSVGVVKFPTEWKFIIHSCSKPPTRIGPLGQNHVYPVAWLVKKTSWMLGMLATPIQMTVERWWFNPHCRKMYYWLVVLTILKNMKVNGKDYSHILWKNKKCSKPPTSIGSQFQQHRTVCRKWHPQWAKS